MYNKKVQAYKRKVRVHYETKQHVSDDSAGGRGSRLHELTNRVAKPAVSYGGKYRIVDFPLSNCANSGVDIVGVLTQYESVLLNSYVAAGGRWGLDARESGVSFFTT